jgi:outer membrane protein assembly factor BamA
LKDTVACILINGLTVLLLGTTLWGCTGLKHVTSEDPLFVGHSIKFEEGSPENPSVRVDLNRVLTPVPNRKFLWMRPSLALNTMLSDSAKKKKFWITKVSEPVKLSQVKPDQVIRALNNRMFHNGYFNSHLDYDTVFTGKKKAKYRYTITLHDPHRLGVIYYPEPVNKLNEKIFQSKEMSLLRSGDIYSLELMKEERARIKGYLDENGYIYFNPEFILFQADTVSEENTVNIRISLKPRIPPESRKSYSIGKIVIHDDKDLDNLAPDTLDFDPYLLLTDRNSLAFEAISRGIFLEPGKLYSREDHLQTVRYFGNLPIIRYASIKFTEGDQDTILNPNIYLTQRKRYAYTAEVNTIFRSTNYFGPGVIFSYTDRNANRGAEQFQINLRGRFEMQVSEGVVNPAYELGLEAKYTLPWLYPSFLDKWGKRQLPRTNIGIGYNLFNRLDLYRLNSLYTDIGYKWSRNDIISHSLNPLEIVFTKIPEESKSEDFRAYLEENPGVQRSFDEQFVLGSGYRITYNPAPGDKSQFYFRGGIDLSGNLLNLIYKISKAPTNSSGRYTLGGIPFSQFIRLKTDFRYSFKFGQQASFATRFIAGLGIPFGNSDIVPYIRQYYVGGTNSLRSFLARSIGPGGEPPPKGFNDLTGDIHLEWNLEYRFTIAGSFKGALFTDLGNIWLFNEDPDRPDGHFRFDSFLNQVAISTGWGLRWDFEFVIARLDFGYTMRTPYPLAGERWASDINLLKPVINIAIGYPF